VNNRSVVNNISVVKFFYVNIRSAVINRSVLATCELPMGLNN
jgi:hypothetical protein